MKTASGHSPGSPFAFAPRLSVAAIFAIAAPRAFADSLDVYTPPPEVAVHWNGHENEGAGEDAAPPSNPPSMQAELRLATTLYDDFQLGGRLGGLSSRGKTPLGFFLDFDARPYGKAVRVRESDVLEYQFREHRFTLSPGASLNIPLESGRAEWTFAGGVGLSWGTYRGSARSGEVAFPIWFETGPRFQISPRQFLAFAYQYFPLPDVSPHRVAVQWAYRWRAPSAAASSRFPETSP